MKPKEVITLIIAVIIIGASFYFMLQLLFPSNNSSNQITESTQVQEIPEKIDEDTYNTVKDLSDYGVPSLSGLGKTDLFSEF